MTMRVLHFYKTSIPDSVGGVEQVIAQVAAGASKLGVHSDVLSLSPRPVPAVLEMDGYRLHRARLDAQFASTGISLSAFSRFAELARRADVVHYHFPWPFMDVVHFMTRVRRPTVVTYHSDIVRQRHLLKLYRPLMWRFLGDVDRIVATSPNYLATSDVLARLNDKVRVIPIGLERSAYPEPTPERLAFWREQAGDRFFLFVGVLRYYKGLHILLEAVRGTDYPVIIVGAGPIEKELKAQAERFGLRNVKLLGHLADEDKVALLTLCYGVLFPSHLRSEAFGISLLEGAMFGKPMISSEIGTGTTYVNIAGQTGLVVPPGDPAALRQAMVWLWENPVSAAAMGCRAEERYREYFTAQQMVRSYVDLYAELAGEPEKSLNKSRLAR